MLLLMRLWSFAVVAFLIQENVLAADYQEVGRMHKTIPGDSPGTYSHRRITRTEAEQVKPFLASLDITEAGLPTNALGAEASERELSDGEIKFAKKMYDAYLKDHRKNIAQVLAMNMIRKTDIPKIKRVVAKAVRDVCPKDGSSFTFSPAREKTVKLPKLLALHNLKRLLDHLAFCRELDVGISQDTQSDLQGILQRASLALVSCDGFGSDFEIADLNRYSSPTTPKLIIAKRNSVDQEEMPVMKSRIKERSANAVQQVALPDDGVVAFAKSCEETSPYAEPENKRFGGINEKWIAAFSARHKHMINFHVPAVMIDGEKREFYATPEGFLSLFQAQQEHQEIIESIPIESIQRYFVLVLLFNFSDSHLGNIRVGKDVFGKYYLISIDHGEALQVFYENPGTASLRFGHFLELFFHQSLMTMHHRIRNFLMNLDPIAEVEFIRAQLNSDVEKLAHTDKDGMTKLYFNRKLDHFRLNLEFLKALGAQHDSTFADAFELRRAQFRLSIFRNAQCRNNCRYIRNLFIKESLVQHTLAVFQNTNDETVLKEQLANESFRQFDPSCEHLLSGKDREEVSRFMVPEERKTAVDSRLDESFFESFANTLKRILFPHIKGKNYHKITEAELNAYQSIGF